MQHPSQVHHVHSVAASSSDAATLLDIALAAHRSGQSELAASLYRDVLALDPVNAHALHYYGVLHYQHGGYEGAARLMSAALERDASDAACWNNRGLVAAALGHPDQALVCYREALQRQPDYADAHNNLGVALQAQGAIDEAIEHYRVALALNAAMADAHLNLGTAFAKLARFDDALACYRDVLSLDPQSAQAHFNAGNAYLALGHHEAATVSFEQALALNAHYAEAHVNLGSLIGKRGDYAGAESHYRQAVALKPTPTHLVCLGGSLGAQGRLAEEEVFYRRALALDPNYADAHQNLAWLLLKRGDYRQGWAEFAQRWRRADYDALAISGVAEWRGEPLDGRSLLVVGEQGFGDHFQFLRFASVLARLGATVDLCVREPLLPLVERIPGVRRAFSGKPDTLYDFWVPMMSVPSCLGTELATIPADIPYLFAKPGMIDAWRERTGFVQPTKRKVGFVWAGSPTFGNDRYRSIALTELSPLGALNDVAWYALQKGPAHAQLADAPPAFRAHDFTAELESFDDTAALIMNLDLVISVDTGIAHLAGALGLPVWLLLPANADWRWLETRNDSPWYPRMRLFRQHTLGDWKPVVEHVLAALRDDAR
ncbi:tetratricopeptide repeat protein [Paraburkholderia sp. D15]|uniref:tetratricopeptide repeat protein n=1 Tax=Paraburkholderia sp. D15 TaxID=2880218 RepID=UPI00247A1FD8|nr:tetratricopeptide repeat protein [Paraburkholderia sp. D15]WGS49724.1 tetratricopeptide repeat protein [Paraburkholderia sp. D15]